MKLLNPLERERYALPYAYAHCGERKLAIALLQSVHRRERKARTRHAERVAERDRPAMSVDMLGILRNAQLAQTGETLRCERLVDLDQVEVADPETQARHELLGRWHRTNAHHARRHRRRCHAKNASARFEPMARRCFLAGEDHGGGAVIDPGRVA